MKPPVQALCLVVLCAVLTGCGDERYRMPAIKLRYDTPIERRASLSTLRRVWNERPKEISPDGNHYERAVLNRAALLGRKINGTETYRAACDFWMSCVREHILRYEEDAHRFKL